MPSPSFSAVLRVVALAASLEQRFNPTLGSVLGVSFRDYLLLLNLANAPKGRMRRVDLAAALSIAQSSISHMGDPLEKRGLVSREADGNDARVSYMVLSPEGRELVKSASKLVEQSATKLFDERWSDEDVDHFGRRLAQLTYGQVGYLG